MRFGLRRADDPRIVNTVAAIDALLRTDTATGPVWHRYNLDGYGEHDDGRAFDGTGVGRGWPLLTGERAHFELSAGRRDEADRLRRVMERQASDDGFFPEQVWDAADLPERELFNGRPSGSAMPLVWAHAEYIKLRRSLADGTVFDVPPQTLARYGASRPSAHDVWRLRHPRAALSAGRTLRIESLTPMTAVWTADRWANAHETRTVDQGLGVHVADLSTASLVAGATVEFTMRFDDLGWDGANHTVRVV